MSRNHASLVVTALALLGVATASCTGGLDAPSPRDVSVDGSSSRNPSGQSPSTDGSGSYDQNPGTDSGSGYDPTPGSSDSGAGSDPSPGTDPGTGYDTGGEDGCDACLEMRCAAQLDACDANAECLALDDCSYACAETDDACYDACDAAHPAGLSALMAIFDCMDASCVAECGGADDPGVDDPGTGDPGTDDAC
jgi:hypothetical protein